MPASPSPTARAILAVTRLRARRLSLWMEHLWQSGQASPDQGPAIGSSEVARLLAADAMAAVESAFYRENAVELSEQSEAAAEALDRDPGWAAIRQTFGLSADEAELLGLLVAVEFDPGLGRVVAYLHDDGRLTQPTPWLAARFAGREPAPFTGGGLRRWPHPSRVRHRTG